MLTVGIIGGNGRMGAAFAKFFRERRYPVLISDKNTRFTATELAKKADVVIVSVPIDVTPVVIEEIAPHVRKSSLLMDVTSVKEAPVKAMLKSKAAVIGTHPMCNETTFGPGQTLLYCPSRAGKWMKWFKETFAEGGGLELIAMTPQKHDEMMAYVQGAIHFSEFVLAKTLAKFKPKVDDLMRLASPSSRLQLKLTARHLAQDPHLYGNIQMESAQNQRVLAEYVRASEELESAVSHKDLAAFTRYFNEGKKYFGKFGEESMADTDQMIHRMVPVVHVETPQKITKNAIATLGPALTHTSFAAEKWVGRRRNPLMYLRTITDIFEAVAKGKVQEGFIPIENRLHGTVRETLDALFEYDVKIVGELQRAIHHCFAVLPGTNLNEIEIVISHAQALNQCSETLKKIAPNANWVTVESTAAAFEHVKEQRDTRSAVIGPERAAKHFGFTIVKSRIENDPDNTTTFIAIAKKSPTKPSRKNPKTSIVFYFHKDKPGSLLRVFQIFGESGINLTRIESRPAPKKFGEYLFYIDFMGNPASPNVKKALGEVREMVAGLKVLGSY